jgi:hypothetical protein
MAKVSVDSSSIFSMLAGTSGKQSGSSLTTRKKALDLWEVVTNLPYRLVPSKHPTLYYTGASLLVYPCMDTRVILHEIAHWLVCTSHERMQMPEFGLGAAFPYVPTKARMTVDNANLEEDRASLLTVFLAAQFGIDAWDTAWDYKFVDHKTMVPAGHFHSCLSYLFRRKLITKEGTPTYSKNRVGKERT